MKRASLAAFVLATAMAVCAAAAAQEQYPSRLITVVVPLTPGTTIDILARLFAESLSKRFGQQVIVANRPGAGGLIAAQTVAGAPADGYTVLLANSGHAILGTLNKNLPFDPVADFAGVSLIGDAPTLVTVAPSLGVRTLRQFVDLAKAKPGTINYGSAGIGTATHLAGVYFASRTGTELVHVPYTVSSTIIADLLGGRIHVTFAPAAFTLPLLQTEGCWRWRWRPMSRSVSRSRSPPRSRRGSITKTRPGTASWLLRRRQDPCSRSSTTRSPRQARMPRFARRE